MSVTRSSSSLSPYIEDKGIKRKREDDDTKKPLKSAKTVENSNPTRPKTDEKKVVNRISSQAAQAIKTHSLPMCGEIYLKFIQSGVKKFEGRIYGPALQKMRIGDHLSLFDRKANWGILCTITSLDVYKSFEKMLETNGVLTLLPQLAEESKHCSKEALIRKGVAIYKSFPGSNRVSTCGVAAIGVTFIKKI